MKVMVLANEDAREELLSKKHSSDISFEFANGLQELSTSTNAGAYFILQDHIVFEDYTIFKQKPVFINSVINTLLEINAPQNIFRINAWPTFLKRSEWEIVTRDEALVKDLFEKLQWQYIPVNDEPGLVAARIVSMIINEAYFALGDDVSTKEEIDIAMKLGTNYPFGPFEWSKKIGLKNIYDLLKKLSITDTRYTVAPELEKEINS